MTGGVGTCGFDDAYVPIKGKNEWGIDTLTRKLTGQRSLLAAFVATLTQGQIFQGYYLQSWDADDRPDVGAITLIYKGLFSGGTPAPKIRNEISPAVGAISASYVGENSGLGRVYRQQVARLVETNGAGAITYVYEQSFPVYTTGATLEFTYDAVQSVYRYISIGRPMAPRYFTVDIPRVPVIKKARLTAADGSVYGRNAPTAFSDLVPITLNKVVAFEAEPVVGTPFYECVDVVRRELGEGDDDTQNTFAGP